MPDAEGKALSFQGIVHTGRPGIGLFKATARLLGWKNTDPSAAHGEQVVSFNGVDVKSATWQQSCGKGRCLLKLRFKHEGGSLTQFIGFKDTDFPAIKAHFHEHFGVALQEQEVATEGWNWGDVVPLEGGEQASKELRVMINGKLGFDVPVAELTQVTVASNTDLNLEFAQEGAAVGEDVLTELRLFIPGGGDDSGAISAERLRQELQQSAGISAGGEAMLTVRDIMLNAPRGKHDFEFFEKSMKIRGKTLTYNIRYQDIGRIFYLEFGKARLGGYASALAFGLNQPMRHGKTLHSWLVLNFDGEKTVPLGAVSEHVWKNIGVAKADHKQEFMVAKLVGKFSGQTIIATLSEFREAHPQKEPGLKCTHKAQQGLMYFSKKSFIYVMKPVIWHRYSDIEAFHFDIGHLRGKSFDFAVQLKSGQVLEFSQVDRDAFDAIHKTLQKHEVPMRGAERLQGSFAPAGARTSTRAAAAARNRPATRASSQGAAAAPRDEGYNEEEDEDFTDEGDDDGDASSEEDLEDEENTAAAPPPKAKRPRRS
mmetsp:Transcript_100134/g.258832  ORF Transcript_100134/g.258832 Transcript_100134/m.258832 type:complete len:539 (-) Transcript_100134:102-1718(-)